MDATGAFVIFLEQEYAWVAAVFAAAREGKAAVAPPVVDAQGLEWPSFIVRQQLDDTERLLVALALCQYVRPELLSLLADPQNTFRLVQCNRTGQLLPTGETLLCLVTLQGTDAAGGIGARLAAHACFATDHVFYQMGVLSLGEVNEGFSSHFGVLKMAPNYRDLFLYNRHARPRFSHEFPAHLLQTALEWEDMVLNEGTATRLQRVKDYLSYEGVLRHDWGLDRQLRQGYRCLFHGPSGTGKTLAATLLGKLLGRDVYRVDLSSVVSKYIGETSKNLNALFNTAEDKNWILFFDEGDALFGKRIDTAQSEDKNTHYANQDTAFLLQRIENFNGLVIVASNLKKNMDDAFMRRFQAVIPFEVQDEARRLEIWERHLPKTCTLEPRVDLAAIARSHPLSAASIVDICNRVALATLQKGKTVIALSDMDYAIREELYK